jgi:2'-5' RNA ligase
MRIFIAAELPDRIRNALSELQHELRPVAKAARWVAPESVHVTLKFIGEIPDSRLEEINAALAGLTSKPIPIGVRGVGFFPGARSPRVLWVGMVAPALQELVNEIDGRMERLGFEREKRGFKPHITLARAKDARLDASLVDAAARYETHEFGSFIVDRIFVFKSTLKPSGAVYEKLREFVL